MKLPPVVITEYRAALVNMYFRYVGRRCCICFKEVVDVKDARMLESEPGDVYLTHKFCEIPTAH